MNQKQLAAHLNMSASAISAALNNKRNIPEATRRRVQEAARELGYTPNAASRIMAYRRHQNVKHNMNIAVLVPKEAKAGFKRCQTGVRQQADTLGLHLNEIVLEKGMRHKRLQQILESRSIQGLLLYRFPPDFDLQLHWSHFGVVAIGHYPECFNRIILNQHQIATECVLHAIEAGYRRPGLLQRKGNLAQVNYLSLGGYLSAMARLDSSNPPPVFEYEGTPQAVIDWIKENRIDCLISNVGKLELMRSKRLQAKLDTLGFYALARNSLENPPGTIGVEQDLRAQGAQAVNMLFGMLTRGEYGEAHIPRMTMIEGRWVTSA
ncbi:LacI family DNA-binding transcriptional regulator [Coraliomargarita parva]|uniref:LacI family DNA-binding transcriptional regulator n=1 Tax=Coraliomargarita parva TaxID=3014050 RepID=UPI0022B4A9E8|nr:LacI family DNA-binding transcriptional regulator [Coraliomargarita parva]